MGGTWDVVLCRVVLLCTAEENVEARERDDLRHERHRERERQRRLEKAGK